MEILFVLFSRYIRYFGAYEEVCKNRFVYQYFHLATGFCKIYKTYFEIRDGSITYIMYKVLFEQYKQFLIYRFLF